MILNCSALLYFYKAFTFFDKLHTCMVCLSVANPDLQIRVHPDSEIRGGSRGWEGGGCGLKKFFSALLA